MFARALERWALLALVIGACANNMEPGGEPLVQTRDLFVVAHQDDDLLFMQPDLIEALRSGAGVTTVYVTAGNGKTTTETDVKKSDERNAGVRAAYSFATGDSNWECGWISVADHLVEHCRLDRENVSQIYLGFPDGNIPGNDTYSLLRLWEGKIEGADSVTDIVTHYSQAGLIEVVAGVMSATQPHKIHVLDVASTHGIDHTDHMITGALTLLAAARTASMADIISYRGYNIINEPINKSHGLFEGTMPMYAYYQACVSHFGKCGEDAAPRRELSGEYLGYLHRRYAVGFRHRVAGLLRNAGQCLLVTTSGAITTGDCRTAQSWHLDQEGELADDFGHCLVSEPTGEMTYGTCDGTSSRRFFIDDEGHVWASIIPPASPDMRYAHLTCLTPEAGTVRAALCGASSAPTWEFVAPAVVTSRATIGLVGTGRAIRTGDITNDGLIDLCAVNHAGQLLCAPGNGTGAFLTATVVARSLPIDPWSLTLGDVDGDGLVDACGLARDLSGLVCATAASGFVSQPWTNVFGSNPNSYAVPGTPMSLAALPLSSDGDVGTCGLSSAGLTCVNHEEATTEVLSTWPRENSIVWLAELDADRNVDWCSATPNGPVCAASGERDVTLEDGIPWGFALGGTFEPSPQDADTGALADIDGDGRADLCSLDLANSRVACARSQGRGFGPLTTLFAWPAGMKPTAMWLGDLDGDGKADACVDEGRTIACALSQ